jgi:hypothetical protein
VHGIGDQKSLVDSTARVLGSDKDTAHNTTGEGEPTETSFIKVQSQLRVDCCFPPPRRCFAEEALAAMHWQRTSEPHPSIRHDAAAISYTLAQHPA